jgi:gliding motility-associated-like protein
MDLREQYCLFVVQIFYSAHFEFLLFRSFTMKHSKIIKLCFMLSVLSAGSLSAQSVGGVTSGAATYCSSTNSGFLSLTGFTGSILNWESSTDGGLTWTNIGNTTPAQSYFNLSVTTCYEAIVQNGAFPPDTSTISCITVYPPSNGGTLSGGGTFCGTAPAGMLSLTGNTGGVTNWQYSTDGGTTWTSIADTNTFLNYASLSGNVIYAAVVQNATCPPDTSSFAVFTVLPLSVGGSVSADDTVCSSSNAGTLNVAGYTGSVVTWMSSADGGVTWSAIPSTGTSLPYSNLTQTTTYAVVVQNGICAADTSAFATITVLPLPAVSAGNDTVISPGQSVVLNGTGTGTPVWSPAAGLDSINIYTPTATPATTTTYVLTVVDANGCSNSDAVIIDVVSPQFNGMITSLFTPNGDGINDFWYIENIQNYSDCEVRVFNVYGQQVYEKKAYKNDWAGTYNGSDLPDGTYFYVLTFDSDDTVYKGSLDILRNK